MLEFVMRFRHPVNAVFFFALVIFNAAWIAFALKKRGKIPFWPVIGANVLLLAAWGLLSGLNHDDASYLHFAWLISRGELPFRDFWDHHSPLLSLLLSPVVRLIRSPAAALDFARLISAAIFLFNAFIGWRLCRRVWGREARLPAYLLVLSSAAVLSQYLILRPDLPMMTLLLAGLYLSLDAPRRPAAAFCSGAVFGLAFAFTLKQYFIFLTPIVLIMTKGEGKPWKLLWFAAGLACGLAPLSAYLAGQGISGQFIFWMKRFNPGLLLLSVHFPFLILAAGTAGAWKLANEWRRSRDIAKSMGLCMFFFSTASALTTTSESASSYYLGFWCFACSIMASGVDLTVFLRGVRSVTGRALIAGAAVSGLVLPNVMGVLVDRNREYARDKAVITGLMRYAQGETAVCIMPYHPLFAADATRLYSIWQFQYAVQYPSVRDDVLQGGFVRRFIGSRPAVILKDYWERDFVTELFQRRLVSAGEYRKLLAFIGAEYELRRVGGREFYIRKDRLDKTPEADKM